MREWPIIFSAPMVRAISAGTKTQTRRVVKPQPNADGLSTDSEPMEYGLAWRGSCGNTWRAYAWPGDRLWVREGFSVAPTAGCTLGEAMRGVRLTVSYLAGGEKHLAGGGCEVASGVVVCSGLDYNPEKYGVRRPSIFMPRWASRITLEVIGVHVERLQDCSEDDARAEGMAPLPLQHGRTAASAYRKAWDSINGKRAPWASNPWVWAVTFRPVSDAYQPPNPEEVPSGPTKEENVDDAAAVAPKAVC